MVVTIYLNYMFPSQYLRTSLYKFHLEMNRRDKIFNSTYYLITDPQVNGWEVMEISQNNIAGVLPYLAKINPSLPFL